MGLFDDMKDRLGFSKQPEWQPDAYAGDGVDEYAYDEYDEGYFEPSDGYDAGQYEGSVVDFDDYNPDKFQNVVVSSNREPQVASYDDYPTAGYGSAGRRSSYASSIGTSSRRSSNVSSISDYSRSGNSTFGDAGATWSTPEDPAFLNNTGPSYDSQSLHNSFSSHSNPDDPYAQFDSDLKSIHRDPSVRMDIVKPKVYADVEKIANAAKAGKTVVLVLTGTKPELAKRILDFSFGVASALNRNVDKVADRVFAISKSNSTLSSADLSYLRSKGIVK